MLYSVLNLKKIMFESVHAELSSNTLKFEVLNKGTFHSVSAYKSLYHEDDLRLRNISCTCLQQLCVGPQTQCLLHEPSILTSRSFVIC